MKPQSYFATLLVLLLLDAAWLLFNKNRYDALVKAVQGSSIKMNVVAACASYVCVYLILVAFVLPIAERAKGDKLYIALRYGGLLGLLVYGVFNFTNMAIFSRYDVFVACLDTIWGALLFFSVTYLHLTVW